MACKFNPKEDFMKTWNQRVLGMLIFLSTLSLPPSITFAQGSLTPPGAPAPTMKSLDQIEPRTPISSVPFVITNSGSYYLASNLNLTVNTNAITIAANDVTLDLNGFTIYTSVLRGSGAGILLGGGNTDITIHNGHITGGNSPYFGSGITYSGPSPVNIHVANVSVTECISYGINLGTNNSTLVEGCTVQSIASYGIAAANVSSSAAYQCGFTAIIANGTASDCVGYGFNGDGVDAYVANNCYGNTDNGYGIYAYNALNCNGSSSTYYGVFVSYTANNCTGISGTGTGVFTSTAVNCYGYSSSSSGGGDGLYADNAQNSYGNCQGSGIGLEGFRIAIGCYGFSYSGTGLLAYTANSCLGQTLTGTAQSIVNKYNMP